MLLMLQLLYIYVASVRSHCFSCFILILHIFHLDIANVVVANMYIVSVCFK
jgi:hypothetical protein